MTINQCIFVSRPKECSSCVQSHKLNCLLNHQHLVLSEAGKNEIAELVKQECSNPSRYKEKAGQEGR